MANMCRLAPGGSNLRTTARRNPPDRRKSSISSPRVKAHISTHALVRVPHTAVAIFNLKVAPRLRCQGDLHAQLLFGGG